jgi:hypothetical protein
MPSATPEESRIVKNMRSGLIELLAGSERYVIKGEQGTFNLAIPGTTVAVYPDRGRLVDPDDPTDEPNVAEDQDQAMTGSFTAYLRDAFSDDYLTLTDFMSLYGKVTTLPNELRNSGPLSPKLITIQWWFNGNKHGDPRNKGFRLPFCKLTGSVAEGSPTLITANFTSFYPKPLPARWER